MLFSLRPVTKAATRLLPPLLALVACLPVAQGAPVPDIPLSAITNQLAPQAYLLGAETLSLTNSRTRLTFYAGSRRLDVADTLLWMNGPAMPGSNDWWFCAADVTNVILPLASQLLVTNRPVRPRIILDPGHGGEDGGATTPGGLILEKRFTLDLAQRVEERLEAQGLDTALTHQTDRELPLAARVAAQTNADCFVSIHINSAPNRDAAGVETFVVPSAHFPLTGDTATVTNRCAGNAFDSANTRLGHAVHSRLVATLKRPDRGLRRARYYVLRHAQCPAILVEIGFLSNTADARVLADTALRDPLADAIANGILSYLGRPLLVIPPPDAPPLPESGSCEEPET